MKHKKIWIIGFLLLVIIGLFFWIYPKVVFVKAILDFSKVDSLHIEGTLTLSNGEYEIDLQGNANYNNRILHGNLSTDYLWNPVSSELYVDVSNSLVKFYLSTNLSDNWITSSQKFTSDSNNDDNKIDISLKDVRFKKVKSERDGEKKYQITISKELFLSFLSNYLKNSDSVPDNMTLYLYLKDDNVSGLVIPGKFLLSKGDNLYLSNIHLRFSSWNGISTIEIPDDIKENSKPIDKNVLETLFL